MNAPQLLTLIDAVESASTNLHSEDHGPDHWRAVSHMGIRLAWDCYQPPLVPFLFGLFHDAMREHDGDDPEHGARGADLVTKLAKRGLLTIPDDDLELLTLACATHTEALPTDHRVLGVCYDADRVNLWRVGIEPHRAFLSTCDMWVRDWISFTENLHGDIPDWNEVIEMLATQLPPVRFQQSLNACHRPTL